MKRPFRAMWTRLMSALRNSRSNSGSTRKIRWPRSIWAVHVPLRAKESFWGMTKLEYLERADQLMNEAVAEAPDNPRVRMIRAISLYKLPERFDKRPVALADFQQLVPIARDGKSDLTLSERQAILYYASLSYEDADMPGAEQLKADCHRLAPDSKYGKLTK